jgi:hypothetical protein
MNAATIHALDHDTFNEATIYADLPFEPAELKQAMRAAYDDIIAFVTAAPFATFYAELMSLDKTQRPKFIASVLFRPEVLRARGLEPPPGILIQNSAFGDRRPTLFAVKKMMPERFQSVWENMNLTFNNEYVDDDVSRSDTDAWRPPLPVALQNELLSAGKSLESEPTNSGIQFGIYAVDT